MPSHQITADLTPGKIESQFAAGPSRTKGVRKRLYMIVCPVRAEITYRLEVGGGTPALFHALPEAVAAYNEA